jgi:hypothetical protein
MPRAADAAARAAGIVADLLFSLVAAGRSWTAAEDTALWAPRVATWWDERGGPAGQAPAVP